MTTEGGDIVTTRSIDSLYSWLGRIAKVVLDWMKENCPENWKPGLEKLQQLKAGPVLSAGNEMLKNLPNTWVLLLGVYLLANSGLLGALVMAILGLIMAMNKLNNNEGQEA
jgi:hypothetical protein